MEREETVRLLNKDIEDEHGAIFQYLNNAYAIGEGEIPCEIEAIPRGEMRHLDWLAELIGELDGVPSVERLFRRMRDDEQYHAEVFEDLLAAEGSPARASGDVDESSPAG